MLENAELDSSKSDKEAKKFVEAHAAVKDSRFELRIPLKAGIEELLDNRVKAEKRLDSLRKRAMKDENWRDFLIWSFRERAPQKFDKYYVFISSSKTKQNYKRQAF